METLLLTTDYHDAAIKKKICACSGMTESLTAES